MYFLHLCVYRVVNGSSTLDKARVEELMEMGLSVWAPHGNLRFSGIDQGRADIQVSFVSGDHGDGYDCSEGVDLENIRTLSIILCRIKNRLVDSRVRFPHRTNISMAYR